eukprot:scaffold26152_cov126-Isochrysis_galbana.AAC.2
MAQPSRHALDVPWKLNKSTHGSRWRAISARQSESSSSNESRGLCSCLWDEWRRLSFFLGNRSDGRSSGPLSSRSGRWGDGCTIFFERLESKHAWWTCRPRYNYITIHCIETNLGTLCYGCSASGSLADGVSIATHLAELCGCSLVSDSRCSSRL